MTTKLLSRRQARWSEFLSRFDFKITYRPEKSDEKPNALTRRSGDLSKKGDERLAHQSQIVLKPRNLELSATNSPDLADDAQEIDIEQLWEQGYREDRIANEVLDALRTGKRQSKHLSLALCKEENGRLLYQDRVYVPDFAPLRLRIIQDHHDAPTAGHPERSKILKLLSRNANLFR